MTRVAVCGERFSSAVEVLGLEAVNADAELVLVDLDDAGAIARAAAIDARVPRVVLGSPERAALVRAAGAAAALAASAEPAVIGPLVVAALPPPPQRATRLIVVAGPRGGAGRTLLVSGIAERMARRLSVLVIDATGSGDAGRRLGLAPAPWSDLEGLAAELTTDQLGIVAAQRDALRVLGGPATLPSPELLAAVTREAAGLADVVIVDAPSIHDQRTAALRAAADRVLLVAPPEDDLGAWIDERAWPIATRSRGDRVGEHAAIRCLPDDPAAVRAAARGPSAVGGALGRAYDEIAELLIIDAT